MTFSVYLDLNWFIYLWCSYFLSFNIYIIPPTLLLTTPSFKNSFAPQYILKTPCLWAWNTLEYILCFYNFCYLSNFFSFSKPTKVCQTQIEFSGKTLIQQVIYPKLCLDWVQFYILRNCWMLLSSVFRPLFFFNALLNVSTNLSACPFNLGWYGGVVTCSNHNDLQKFLNSLHMNWVPLSQTVFLAHQN